MKAMLIYWRAAPATKVGPETLFVASLSSEAIRRHRPCKAAAKPYKAGSKPLRSEAERRAASFECGRQEPVSPVSAPKGCLLGPFLPGPMRGFAPELEEGKAVHATL